MSSNRTFVVPAALCAALMIAAQVAGKATRDALFLTLFPVTSLPVMIVVSSLACILVALASVRVVTRFGPDRMLLGSFAASALAFVFERWLYGIAPRATAVALYLHLALLGLFTVSAFWSLLAERFDPRAARRAFGRVAAASTVGGIAGGLLAARLASGTGLVDMLIPLSILNAGCFALAWPVAGPRARDAAEAPAGVAPADDAAGLERGIRRIFADRYLRDLTLFVLVGTIGTTVADYVFKAEAAHAIPDASRLLRFFAFYYTASGVLTWVAHVTLTRRMLGTAGPARTVAALPAIVAATGGVFLAVPGLVSALVFRGSENVCRNSLFRSGYELLYTPIPLLERRAAKPVVDIGAERAGDVLGGALAKLVLLAVPAAIASRSLAAVTMAAAAGGLLLARRLQQGYVRTLERNLAGRAGAAAVDAEAGAYALFAANDETMHSIVIPHDILAEVRGDVARSDLPREAAALADLLSGEEARILPVLGGPEPLPASCVPAAISLLATDGLSRAAIRALRRVVPRSTGQLVDALLDPELDAAVRRRLPRILANAPTERAVEGLVLGLEDWRFEVRYHAARALARIMEHHPALVPDARRVHAAVLREIEAGGAAWESSGPLAARTEASAAGTETRILRDRADRSMEHVFTLLSLVHPREPLRVAFTGLYSADAGLRGTALEYLERILPAEIRAPLWPYLERRDARARAARAPGEALRDLARANPSVEIDLRELRGGGEPGEG